MSTTAQALPETQAVADTISAVAIDGVSKIVDIAVGPGKMTGAELVKLQEAAKTCMQGPSLNENWVCYHEDLRRDTPIMRFMPLKYFLEMIENCRNTLMHVSTWVDVYEGLIYRQKYFTLDNNKVKSPVSLETVYGDFFGQCWTKAKYDSELLWNARCPNKDGVCIKTTVGRLADSVERMFGDMYKNSISSCCRIDKIDYQDEANLNNWTKQFAARSLSSFGALIDLFFIKRESFRDEDEVRLLYVHESSNSPLSFNFYAKKVFVQYEILKSEFLTEVLLDPRMSANECQEIKCAVCKANWRCNGAPLQVHQSSLYQSAINEFII